MVWVVVFDCAGICPWLPPDDAPVLLGPLDPCPELALELPGAPLLSPGVPVPLPSAGDALGVAESWLPDGPALVLAWLAGGPTVWLTEEPVRPTEVSDWPAGVFAWLAGGLAWPADLFAWLAGTALATVLAVMPGPDNSPTFAAA
jgi:hypothetical protein